MRILIWSFFMLTLVGCQVEDRPTIDHPDLRLQFTDLIDHHGVPEEAEDWSVMPFSDQGAWFGFSLPPDGSGDLGAGFNGPFLMTGGRWLSPRLVGLKLPGAHLIRSVGLPGMLRQLWRAGDLEIEQTLWFESSRVALVRSTVHNTGDHTWTLNPVWVGRVYDGAANLEVVEGGILARTPDGDRIRVVFGEDLGASQIEDDGYRISLAAAVTMAPDESTSLDLAVSMTPVGDPEPDMTAALDDAGASLARNTARWNHFLHTTIAAGTSDEPARIIAVKAIQTLVNNWRGPTGRFEHGGLFPSSNVWYFNGFWAWDSWKHAVALARFDPSIASDQLRLMAAQQDDLGMIADVVYLDPADDNWRNSKPPLLGWALHEVHEATGDTDLVRELYPLLVHSHEFWYAHRDHDGDGLCEYGSTDGTMEAARWESGMDNAVRFDEIEMLENHSRAWSMNQESVDLNSYLYREKLALRDLATVLGLVEEADRWESEAASLRNKILSTMFDDITGWFYDTNIDSGEIVPVMGPEGWIPLWAGVATEAQASRVRATLLDPEVFRTHVPFPTVARDHPGFSEGYWRGLVWLDQVYFAIEGLRAYGYKDDAEALTALVLANLNGAAVPGEPLYENYHPLTGEGRNVRHFSWTAAHLLLLALEDPSRDSADSSSQLDR